MKKKILISSTSCLLIADPYIAGLRRRGFEVVVQPQESPRDKVDLFKELLPGTNALIGGQMPLTEELIGIAGKLQVMSICASGFNRVNLPLFTRSGVVVTNVTGPEMVNPVADHTFGLMLAVARQVPYHDRMLKENRNYRSMGTLVWGKKLGIIGLGAIGKGVVRRSRGFSMEVLAYDKYIDESFAEKWGVRYVSLEELLKESDFLSLHLRLNDETRNILGERELSMMKPSAYLINAARQFLVDGDALYRVLSEKRIAGAALDDRLPREVITLDNVIATPHIGNLCRESLHEVLETGINNAIDVLEGKVPSSILNREVYDVLRSKSK